MNFKNCPFCNCDKLYILQNNYIKCKNCTKKFSPKKIATELQIINYFCKNINAQQTSKELNLNYKTIHNKYTLFRKLCASYLEKIYQDSSEEESSYEEYYYFTQREKNKKSKSIYNAVNIIGFYSNKMVYTLLMPSLPKTVKEDKDKSFEKYLQWHKIHSYDNSTSKLKEFWNFLEINIKIYQGVNNNSFFYYLKEFEFKYNFSKEDQVKILQKIYLV